MIGFLLLNYTNFKTRLIIIYYLIVYNKCHFVGFVMKLHDQ